MKEVRQFGIYAHCQGSQGEGTEGPRESRNSQRALVVGGNW